MKRVVAGTGPTTRPRNDESNGLAKTLWADLRRKELPHGADPVEDDWYDEHQDVRREFAARLGRAHNVSAERRESWRRRYWNS